MEYLGVVYRIREIAPENNNAILELETLATPVIKDAREASAVIIEYRRDPKLPSSQDDGKIEYLVMAPLSELKLVQLDSTPEVYERLRLYVQDRLRASGVVDEYHSNPARPDSVAALIVGDAWRQFDRKKYADMGIEHAIKHPPATIDSKHFSLRTFIKEGLT